jgi:hypothetical protein
VGSTEDAHQHLVDKVFIILDVAVVDGVGLGIGEILGKYTRKNLKRLRA